MNVEKLQMDKDQARDLYNAYLRNRGQMTNDDRAIAAIYKRIAQGKLVIRALASITAAGLNAAGQPKLAIARADEKKINCCIWTDSCRFEPNVRGYVRAKEVKFTREHWGLWWESHFGQHPHAGPLKQGIEQLRQALAVRDATT